MDIGKARIACLEVSGRVLPWALGLAFVFSYYTKLGTAIILALSGWYLSLNWRAVLRDRWALIVIGLFAAIAAKDGFMLAIGQGSFRAFAKSGSRVFVLAGCAALLSSHERECLEKAFEAALGITFAVIGATFVAMRAGWMPWIFNPNTFGMLGVWFPLVLASRLRRKGGRQGWLAAIGVLALGGCCILADALANQAGSRTAPVAFLLGAVFILLPRRPKLLGRAASAVVVAGALVSITVLSVVYVPKLDAMLSMRQQLWQAYALRGAERPFVGWGFSEEDDNRRIVGPLLETKPIYAEFRNNGYGPHNAFLGMFFENGALAALLFAALLMGRALKPRSPPGPFDVALMAYMAFMSADAMNPGGLTFLGYYLGVCLLARGEADRGPSAGDAEAGS